MQSSSIQARVLGSVLMAGTLACQAPQGGFQSTLSNELPPHAECVEVTKENGKINCHLREFPQLAVQQEQPVWCWAACAQMILKFNGVETTQEEVAKRIQGVEPGGEVKVEMASRYEILCALNPDHPRSEFEAVWAGLKREIADMDSLLSGSLRVDLSPSEATSIALDRLAPEQSPAVAELLDGQPAVVGMRESKESREGHAYVLYGADFEVRNPSALNRWAADAAQTVTGKLFSDAQGFYLFERLVPEDHTILAVHLIDPSDGIPLEMGAAEFAERVDFVITRKQARMLLEAWSGLVLVEQTD